jgi:hypothetical protein
MGEWQLILLHNWFYFTQSREAAKGLWSADAKWATKRLPTEAKWEYASGGGKEKRAFSCMTESLLSVENTWLTFLGGSSPTITA